eukprot:491943_1
MFYSLYTDLYKFMLSFLNGKDLARLSTVCTKTNKCNILEKVAYNQFKTFHPTLSTTSNIPTLLIFGYVRSVLSFQINTDINTTIIQFYDDPRTLTLLQQHIRYLDMQSNSYKYLYWLCTVFPKIQLINRYFQKQIQTKTDYQFLGHVTYMTEKVMGCGNIILLVNTLQYLKTNNIKFDAEFADFFCLSLRCYGGKIGQYYCSWNQVTENEFNDEANANSVFTNRTKLHLFKHHTELLKYFLGKNYELILHMEMINCCNDGLVEEAIEYRKLGAVIRPDMETERKWKYEMERLHFDYIEGVVWADLRNPERVTLLEYITKELLQNKLEAIVGVYSVKRITEDEKLRELKLIIENKYYSIQQMVNFGEALIRLDAVKIYIKNDLMNWCCICATSNN